MVLFFLFNYLQSISRFYLINWDPDNRDKSPGTNKSQLTGVDSNLKSVITIDSFQTL